jgi:hippurate hydrolase
MGSALQIWIDGAMALMPDAIALRRKIHEHPELGLHVPKTAQAVREALAGLDVKIEQGPSTSGMIVTLEGHKPGRTILLRGDMDALPMPEDTGLAFASKELGKMHACGHDSHTAMLAMAVRLLHAHRQHVAGTVKFMFQPGEEGAFGALRMIEDGLIDRAPRPDAAFAIHIAPNAPSGVITSRPGPIMASTDEIHIDVRGRGGHASMPHQALDPIPIACEIVTALSTFVTRQIDAFDPVIIAIGKIASGTTDNVIPESAHMLGTLRAFSPDARARAKEGITRTAIKIAEAHGASATVRLEEGYAVTVNDARAVRLVSETARTLFGNEAYTEMSSPIMGAEDWSYVLQRVPGCMVFLGVAPMGCDHRHAAPCHSNRMLLDEAAMARGIALHAALAHTFLEHGLPTA